MARNGRQDHTIIGNGSPRGGAETMPSSPTRRPDRPSDSWVGQLWQRMFGQDAGTTHERTSLKAGGHVSRRQHDPRATATRPAAMHTSVGEGSSATAIDDDFFATGFDGTRGSDFGKAPDFGAEASGMGSSGTTLLLDFDGVINDAATMLRAYGKGVAQRLSTEFGGEHQQWLDAHNIVMRAMTTWSGDIVREVNRAYHLYYREENRRWIVAMFRYLRRSVPDEMTSQELADRLRYEVPRDIATPLPGAVDAVHALADAGHRLVLSSAGCEAHCRGALEALSIDRLFGAVYGSDIVDTFKAGPDYYDAILDQQDLMPDECIAIDDRPHVLQWARSLGISTVQIQTPGKPADPAADLVLDKLADLPARLPELVDGAAAN